MNHFLVIGLVSNNNIVVVVLDFNNLKKFFLKNGLQSSTKKRKRWKNALMYNNNWLKKYFTKKRPKQKKKNKRNDKKNFTCRWHRRWARSRESRNNSRNLYRKVDRIVLYSSSCCTNGKYLVSFFFAVHLSDYSHPFDFFLIEPSPWMSSQHHHHHLITTMILLSTFPNLLLLCRCCFCPSSRLCRVDWRRFVQTGTWPQWLHNKIYWIQLNFEIL